MTIPTLLPPERLAEINETLDALGRKDWTEWKHDDARLALECSDSMRDHIAALTREWLDMDSAPLNGDHVLVSTDFGTVGEAFYEEHDKTWYWSGNHWTDAHDGSIRYPIAWQSLPAAAPLPNTFPEALAG